MKILKKYLVPAFAGVLMSHSMASCSDEFLEPQPLSFFEPSVVFTTEAGMDAAMAMSDRNLRNFYIWYNLRDSDSPVGTDYLFSDLMVFGMTDAGSGMNDNMADRMTPNSDGTRGGFVFNCFWNNSYTGIKYANGIISSIPNVTNISEELRNQTLGRAYFHRAYNYYHLIFSFGDVPLITKLPQTPKEDYYSTKKEAIIKKMIEDLEFAVEWVPTQSNTKYYGMINKEACKHLLVKFYLAAGRFKDAETLATDLIEESGLSLMTTTFGTNTTETQGEPRTLKITRNVIWDLHRPENKIGSFNMEYILGMPNLSEESFVGFNSMRTFGPYWNDGNIKTPDGKSAVQNWARNNANYNPEADWVRAIGRGIATYRLTHFAQHSLWEVNGLEDNEDLRHNSEVGNWVTMNQITYNSDKTSDFYGKSMQLYAEEDYVDDNGTVLVAKGTRLVPDTIRSWFDFPHYKYYYYDAKNAENLSFNNFAGVTLGGNGNMYLFRLAETYLLRAEARLYQGNASGAAEDVNALRRRAKCSQFYNGSVNIGDIMNERARELLMEEFRHEELVRVSMLLAMTGIPDEWGNVYSEDNWDKQDGTDETGGSYWYQRLMHHSYYNKGVINSGGKELNYRMDKHNLFYPIPFSAIEDNKKGVLKQNYGYSGYDPNVNMFETWQEAVEAEDH